MLEMHGLDRVIFWYNWYNVNISLVRASVVIYIRDPIRLRCKDNERYQNRMKFLYQVGSEIGFPNT